MENWRQDTRQLAFVKCKDCGSRVAMLERTVITDSETGAIVDDNVHFVCCRNAKNAKGKGTRDRDGRRSRERWGNHKINDLSLCQSAECPECGRKFEPADLAQRLQHLVKLNREKGTV